MDLRWPWWLSLRKPAGDPKPESQLKPATEVFPEPWSPRHARIREVLLEAFVHHEQIETLVVAWKTKPDGPEKTWTISTRLTGPDGKWALQDAQQILNHLHASLSKYP